MDLNAPFFDDSHRDLASRLELWCASNLQGDEQEDVDRACREYVALLGKAGWLTYCVPGEFGGALPKLDSRALCVLRERLAYHAGLADFAFAMQGLGSGAITLYGSPDMKARYLPKVAVGE